MTKPKSAWRCEHKKGDTFDTAYGVETYNETIHTRPVIEAGYVVFDNGVQIREDTHISGAGPEYFGGVSEWPVVELMIPFPHDREDLQKLFSQELRVMIDQFIEKYHLMP